MRTRARLREWAQAFGQLICLILRDLVVAYRASGGRLPVLAPLDPLDENLLEQLRNAESNA